ncbi:unnamed protein product [Mycena citricolor]|uniref:Uncharacterized protein n=1 Tax=Mycena citricolor TaxID=2018698 RepID=A0AAD2H9Y6_9AGAR|nr:unnamed protein product [Mycena citricolor]
MHRWYHCLGIYPSDRIKFTFSRPCFSSSVPSPGCIPYARDPELSRPGVPRRRRTGAACCCGCQEPGTLQPQPTTSRLRPRPMLPNAVLSPRPCTLQRERQLLPRPFQTRSFGEHLDPRIR